MGGTTDIPELDNWEDAFENQIADRTNVLDLAGHYPYSPERWRLFVDGTRQFPEYGSVAQYNHAGDYHELNPAAGETVTFESAERPRYVVAYELSATWAFAVNQSLASGDSIRVGLYDGRNGWYMEHTGDQADDIADFVLERDGNEVYRERDRDIHAPVTRNARLRLVTGWYDITRQRWVRSFSDQGGQQNPDIAEISTDKRGSKTGNLPAHFSVTASGSTTDLVLEAGSTALVNLGRTTPLKRTNQHTETVTLDATGTWVPLLAFRADPDRDIVNTQLIDIALNEFGGNADVQVAVQGFDPSKVLDSTGDELVDADYATPEIFLAENTVIETTTNVEQIPDETGSTGTSQTNPGGIQLGADTLSTAGGNATATNAGTPGVAKRPLYGRDVGVVLAFSSATGDVTFTLRYEEDW